jgi:RNA polymerase sigma-70 factor, ECF subfamily
MNRQTSPDIEFDNRLRQLLARCAAADGPALECLYGLVSPALFSCLSRMLQRRTLAEEALQDVFITIWQRAGHYRPERGRPMTWLISIARYRAIDLLRRERSVPALLGDLPEPTDAASERTEAALVGAELLDRCLELLSREQRRCLELAFIDGNSHADISRLTGRAVGTVKSWIRRGLQSLKACLES